jgi:alkylation response protein AidB-like acyl-CoA dehydrogenase
LRGSGSCDFEVREAFVPTEHVHEFFAPPPRQPGALYRLPNICAFPWSIAGVPLGIARAAIDCFAGIAMKKTRAGSSSPLAERETVQSKIGEAEALYGAARAFLCEAMGELMAALDGPSDRFLRARAGLRLALAHAADNCVAIVDSMARLAGTAAIFESVALERCVRDVHAAVKHVAMAPANYILNGRLRLGLDAGTNRF